MPKDYKLITGLTSYEVHRWVPDHEASLGAGWSHHSSYRHPDHAKDAIKRLRESKKAKKNYGSGHDMEHHGEGKPYNES